MPASSPSKITATSIPNITALREQLDYGNAQLNRCNIFYDDVRGFRKKFRTSKGLPGPDLHDWKKPEQQAGLDEMTTAYLDRDGNGALFWPDSKIAANYNKLQYSRDRQRIKRLMKQLFFRLNQQQYRNKRYKNKDKQGSIDPLPKGLSRDDPIDIEDLVDSSKDLPLSPSDRPIQSAETASSNSKNVNTSAINRGQKIKMETPDAGDSWQVPKTPEPFEEMMKRVYQIRQASKRKQGVPTSDQAAKRPRTQTKSPRNSTGGTSPLESPPPLRSSGRPRKTVRKEGYTDDFDFLDGNESREPTPTTADIPNSSQGLRNDQPVIRPFATFMDARSPEVNAQPELSRADSPGNPKKADFLRAKPWERVFSEQPSDLRTYPREHIIQEECTQPVPAQLGRPQVADSPDNVKQADSSRAKPQEKVFRERPSDLRTYPEEHPTQKEFAQPAQEVPPLNLSESDVRVSSDNQLQNKLPVVAAEPAGERREAGSKLVILQPQAPTKPKIDFIYRIILSRTPIYSYRSWNPTGNLEDTSLSQIIEELGLPADAKGVIFTVEGPNFRAVEEIPRDNETRFTSFIRQIKRVIRGLLMSGRGINSPLVFEMEIEQIRDNTTNGDEEFDDDFVI